jgi:hypothetical protein
MKDKKSVRFISTTVIGGVLFLVPVVFLGMILTKAAVFMMVIAKPMAAWIPVDSIGGIALANLIAVVAVILLCFLAGLVRNLNELVPDWHFEPFSLHKVLCAVCTTMICTSPVD